MTKYEARLIAEELAKLIKDDIVKAVSDCVPKPPEEPMTVKEAAAYLNISSASLYQKIDFIPHDKVGGKLRFERHQLDRYLQHLREARI